MEGDDRGRGGRVHEDKTIDYMRELTGVLKELKAFLLKNKG